MKKVLFLDIDGVLCIQENFCHDLEDNESPFAERCVEQLHRIVEATYCDIVISSSWRKKGDVEHLRELFKRRGFKYPNRIIGRTVTGQQQVVKGAHFMIPRGLEIKQWVDVHLAYPWIGQKEKYAKYNISNEKFVVHPDKRNSKKEFIDYTYCILDDDSDMLLWQKDNYVKTSLGFGLTQGLADKAIRILNQN